MTTFGVEAATFVIGFSTAAFGTVAGSTMLGFESVASDGGVGRSTGATGFWAVELAVVLSADVSMTFSFWGGIEIGAPELALVVTVDAPGAGADTPTEGDGLFPVAPARGALADAARAGDGQR